MSSRPADWKFGEVAENPIFKNFFVFLAPSPAPGSELFGKDWSTWIRLAPTIGRWDLVGWDLVGGFATNPYLVKTEEVRTR